MDPLTWQLPYGLLILSLFVIVMLRANGTYWLGRGVVAGAEHTRWRRVLDSRAYRTGSEWLNRWGPLAVTFSFAIVGIQTMVNLAAGVTRMPLRRYLPAVTVGCVIWAFIYGTGGMISYLILAKAWELSPVLTIPGIVVIVGAVGAFFLLPGGSKDRAAQRASAAATTNQPSNRLDAPLSADCAIEP